MVNHEGSSKVTLAVQNLSVKFGTKVVLNSIIAKIEPGRITVLIGPNGAGKSTLLSGFAGHLADYSGLITIDETPIDNFTPKQLAALRAVMMQSDNLVFEFSVSDVIRMGLLPHVTYNATAQTEVIEDLADRCGIRHLLHQSILRLSGGEKQRVHFCRCLIQIWCNAGSYPDSAQYLILDEPTSSQDIAGELRILNLVKERSSEGVGVLLVLHDLNIAAHFGDSFYLLKNGSVFAQGEADEVLTESTLSNVYETPVKIETRENRIQINTF